VGSGAQSDPPDSRIHATGRVPRRLAARDSSAAISHRGGAQPPASAPVACRAQPI